MFKLIALSIVLFLVGCGTAVEVPPAHVGRILGKEGYQSDVITPSKFRLPACMAYCDKLVILEASDNMIKEDLRIFLPKEKLNVQVHVRGTFSVMASHSEQLFDRISAKGDDRVLLISASDVYKIYGLQSLRGVVRAEVSKYKIMDVMLNREKVSNNILVSLQRKLKETNTPIDISRLELSDIQPPQVIVDAQEAAKKREIEVQKAEADAQIELVKAARQLEIAKKNRLVEREKAEAIAEQNRIAAASVSDKLLEYKKLETAERIFSKLAQSQNTIIIPADSSSFTDMSVFSSLIGKEVKNER